MLFANALCVETPGENRSPVWSFFRQKLPHRPQYPLPHRLSTSALPPKADILAAVTDFRF